MSSKEIVFTPQEDRSSFNDRISDLTSDERGYVIYAYDFAKFALEGKKRESGEPAFEHSRGVSLILIDELQITDPEILASALLHDTGEDSDVFGRIEEGMTNRNWRTRAAEKIEIFFGQRVSNNVMALTKPFIDGVAVMDRKDKDAIYPQQLVQGGPDAILLKATDRLDNSRTLEFLPQERQDRIIKETLDVYFPLFESIKHDYPQQINYLIMQMKEAILRLEQ